MKCFERLVLQHIKAYLPPNFDPYQFAYRTNRDGTQKLQYARNFQPQNDEVRHIRVLLYGPVGAGKSSFINSVSNVLRGKMTIPALTGATVSDTSLTKKYETHKIQKEGRGTYFPFVFNDIMGLEDGTGRGVCAHDLKLAMMGHVTEGYKFNPASPLSSGDADYEASPTVDDKVHVLVCFYSANAAAMNTSVLKKMKEIREAANDLGIPQLAVITKIDEACGETDNFLRNVYKSKHLKKKMTDFSSSLGIPMNCILPVKNYSKETQIDVDVDTLILDALRLIIDFGDDYTDKL
ncbi:interferon-induced protein 44-like [Nematolebias whitei]|uniref:interferon-induced protein 44-like n=1 Tax=Nematolebias whitei TaxID=451745 RepID=UPI00189A155B|nr:interferon-induced protein 44-like [Nematolebias whitei]